MLDLSLAWLSFAAAAIIRIATTELGPVVLSPRGRGLVGFQVSATQLIKNLSVDPDLRARAIQASSHAETLAESARPFSKRNEQVLDELVRDQPHLADTLEQMSGRSVDWADARAELVVLLEDRPEPERAQALQRYDELVKTARAREDSEGASLPQAALDQLALVDIEFWGEGLRFFYGTDDSHDESASGRRGSWYARYAKFGDAPPGCFMGARSCPDGAGDGYRSAGKSPGTLKTTSIPGNA